MNTFNKQDLHHHDITLNTEGKMGLLSSISNKDNTRHFGLYTRATKNNTIVTVIAMNTNLNSLLTSEHQTVLCTHMVKRVSECVLKSLHDYAIERYLSTIIDKANSL